MVNASGELLPDISSTISGTYESSVKETSTSTTEDDIFSDKYKLTIIQNLYDAGYNQLEIERSKILLDNEILNFQIMVEDLILDAITGYLTVLNYKTSLQTTKKNFESVTKVLEETNNKTFFFVIHNNSCKILNTIKSRCVEFKLFFTLSEKIKILKNIIKQYKDNFKIETHLRQEDIIGDYTI